MQLKLPQAQDIAHHTVLVRVDFNVPLTESNGKTVVANDERIKAALPTLTFLLEHQAKVIVMSHLGRPEKNPDPRYAMAPVVDSLKSLLTWPVHSVTECVGTTVQQRAQDLQPGEVLVLENLRFHPEEEANDEKFAQQLASLADVYINDAFSTSHRAHASVAAVTHFLPSFAGLGLAAEVAGLNKVLDNPTHPFVVIIGGAKISDKVEAVVNLAHRADVVLLGGGVANTFLKAEGMEIHKSYLQDAPADLKKKGIDYVNVAHTLLAETRLEKQWLDGHIPLPKILYPLDFVAAPNSDATTTQVVDLTHDAADTPADLDLMYLDIGPKTVQLYQEIIATAGTVFWNGPLGVWEQPPFVAGTTGIATAVANATTRGTTTVIGGGDTGAALEKLGFKNAFSYVSTAGGAALDFLAGKQLPGLQALMTT